ncbi:MAG: aminomethyl-transferring glycine dehydrogenase subunit GcvPB [Nonomuraea sp.]|nr:aminomethyl-transferring glycine dehydrogenase subunit GcvPB [Nonomuraea sp.]
MSSAGESFAELPVKPKPPIRRFHQARWDEPIIFELSQPGRRGIAVPEAGAEKVELPESVRRATPPKLPEMSQLHVLRHYLRLSQENLGFDLNVDVGQGTCTMKYSPKVNDKFADAIAELHPAQHVDTVQGVLAVYHGLERMLAEISGMARVSLQPGSGSAAIYANIAMIRAYHEANGEGHRDQVITTMFSHPSNAACAKVAGYEVITLMPDAEGYPDLEALKAAVGPRTAALMITNPEDTGIFNPRIQEFVDAVHEVGGLACYDQANANGILGITRAADAGFDLGHFNLHKTFSTPHACGGPAGGACGVSEKLVPFLPGPVVSFEDGRYGLEIPEKSVGKIRPGLGVTPNVVRAYAWIMSLGAKGLRQVAETAVLNNNYLMHKILQIPGASAPWDKRRVEQVRYSWQELSEETGVHSEEIGVRASDFGVHYWTSHHPYLVPEPFTVEPTESFSKEDLDEFAAILAHVAAEARENPEFVKGAPYNQTIHKIDMTPLDDPKQWAPTWRAYVRKHLSGKD